MLLIPGRKALKNELGLPSQGAVCEQKIAAVVHTAIWTWEFHDCCQQRRRVGVLKLGVTKLGLVVVVLEQELVEWVDQVGLAGIQLFPA